MYRQIVVHREHVEHVRDIRDERQVALRVVRQGRQQRAVDRQRDDVAVAERIAVGRRFHHVHRAEDERGAGLVLDHDGHMQLRGELWHQDAHQHVRRAAGRRLNDEADRFVGIRRRGSARKREEERGQKRAHAAIIGHAHPRPAFSCRCRLQLRAGADPARSQYRGAGQLQGRHRRDRGRRRAAKRQQAEEHHHRRAPGARSQSLSSVVAHGRRRLPDGRHRRGLVPHWRGDRAYQRRPRGAGERHDTQRHHRPRADQAPIKRAFVSVALFLAARAAPAALPDEIQVYTDDLEAPGERGIELHVNTTPRGRTRPDYPGEVVPQHALRITPEISWGLTRNWDAGVYLPFVRSAEGADFFAGPRLRLKWLPLRPPPGAGGVFAGINGELAFVQQRFEEARRTAEIRPILGYRGETWLFSFNPIVTADLAGTDKGVLMFAPAAKLSRSLSQGTELGVEYYP